MTQPSEIGIRNALQAWLDWINLPENKSILYSTPSQILEAAEQSMKIRAKEQS